MNWNGKSFFREISISPGEALRSVMAAPFVRQVLMRIERLLHRTQLLRHVLQVDPDSRPRSVAAAFTVDEDVRRFEVRRRFRMPCFPAFESRERIRLLARATDFDERTARRPPGT